MLSPGSLLAGKYRVERVLGEGGMGIVVAAYHEALDQRVALKVLRLVNADRRDVVERFLREARNAVRLRSQHVARVIDVGTIEGGLPFIVLEYLEGADLDALVRTGGPMPYPRAIAMGLQACEAVAEAHALGIIHRDLKPHNLFLTTGVGGMDLLKVLDFGIAKSMAFSEGAMTRSNSSVGSPLYMSPEQMRSPRDVDARTDIWSLGVTLYEIIAGTPPFDAESFPELVLRVQDGRFPPLSSVRPDVPIGLSDAIGRCLARDPADRHADVAALATALEPFTWPEARVSAENARRALVGGVVVRTASNPSLTAESAPPARGFVTRGSDPGVDSTARPSLGPGSSPRLRPGSGSDGLRRSPSEASAPPSAATRGSRPHAWSESVSISNAGAPPPGARRRAVAIALSAAGVLVVGAVIVLAGVSHYLMRSTAPAASAARPGQESPSAADSHGLSASPAPSADPQQSSSSARATVDEGVPAASAEIATPPSSASGSPAPGASQAENGAAGESAKVGTTLAHPASTALSRTSGTTSRTDGGARASSGRANNSETGNRPPSSGQVRGTPVSDEVPAER